MNCVQHCFLTLLQSSQGDHLVDLMLRLRFAILDQILRLRHHFLQEEQSLIESQNFVTEWFNDMNHFFAQICDPGEVLALRTYRLDERIEFALRRSFLGGH